MTLLPKFKDKMSTKHPAVARTYILHAFNLVPAGRTIASVAVSATPTGLTVVTPATISGTDAKSRISAGTDGTTYEVLWVLTLDNGDIEVAIMEIPVSSKGDV